MKHFLLVGVLSLMPVISGAAGFQHELNGVVKPWANERVPAGAEIHVND